MRPSTVLVVAGVALALAACNRPDQNRTTSTPPGVKNATAVTAPILTPSAPAAPAERGPIAPNANTMAPGTDASVAFADTSGTVSVPKQAPKGGTAEGQARGVEAQEAAAEASDTAAADAAKKAVNADSASDGLTARDTPANSPRHGALTKEQEVNQMPKAGQVNNHSSTALEQDSSNGNR